MGSLRPNAYNGNEPYIFVSYSHLDSNIVLPIIQALQARGVRIWYDAGIEVGTEWPEYIAEHLDGCTGFLAFISNNSINSHNCRREINFAIELHKDPLVVYLEDVQLTLGMRMQLGSLQAIFYNRHSTRDSFLDELCRSRTLFACQSPQNTYAPAKNQINAEKAYSEGWRLYNEAKYEAAVRFFRQAAEQGHCGAQHDLGCCYYNGNGVSQNYTEAVKWFRLAAEQGYDYAQYMLGLCYDNGNGVPLDITSAAMWYRKAAEQGHANAQDRKSNV